VSLVGWRVDVEAEAAGEGAAASPATDERVDRLVAEEIIDSTAAFEPEEGASTAAPAVTTDLLVRGVVFAAPPSLSSSIRRFFFRGDA
jgi:hypothetical protein